MEKQELDQNELEQVTGGFNGYEVTEMRYDFSKGDTFQMNERQSYFVVESDVNKVSTSDMIRCKRYFYNTALGKYTEDGYQNFYVNFLLDLCTYRGNGIIGADDIWVDDGPGIRLR